ncbi:hypothetical protein L9F63_019182, partial [Diploptera punctata]
MGFSKVMSACFLVAVVRAGNLDQGGGYGAPQPSYGATGGSYNGVSSYAAPNAYNGGYNGYNGGGVYGGGGYNSGYGHGHGGGYDEQPKSYQFGYAVKDYATGTDYNRHETSDGNTIHGEYRVQLPDGRTQIVTYTADWKNGYQAQVRYEGEAHYPDVSYNNGGGHGGAPSSY